MLAGETCVRGGGRHTGEALVGHEVSEAHDDR